jgi:hypothetical protein
MTIPRDPLIFKISTKIKIFLKPLKLATTDLNEFTVPSTISARSNVFFPYHSGTVVVRKT